MSGPAKCVFARLLALVDDDGRAGVAHGDPVDGIAKLLEWPAGPSRRALRRMVGELSDHGCLVLADGEISLPRFGDYQAAGGRQRSIKGRSKVGEWSVKGRSKVDQRSVISAGNPSALFPEEKRGEEKRKEQKESVGPAVAGPDVLAPSKRARKAPEPDPRVEALVAYWSEQSKHGDAGPGTDIGKKRRARVAARLREGRSVEEIKRAIDGCLASDWHRENGQIELATICSPEKFEAHILRPLRRDESGAHRIDDRPAWKRVRFGENA